MKRFFIFIMLLSCGVATAEAQSWVDALKKVATDYVDEATGGKLTAVAIVGTWGYKKPAVRFDGDDAAGNVAGALVGSSADSKLTSVFEKVGIREGICSITFDSSGNFSMPVKSKTLSGTYTFDPETHVITLDTGKLGSFSGRAYINGTQLELVFPARKLVDLVVALGSKVSALSSVVSMFEKFENAYIGFAFER
ncbi:MAG: DUF4923 family protein [Alistipes sp.]|nr:DUF4923 family protein [Alistipes sp.]